MSPVFFTTFKLPENFIPLSPFWLDGEKARDFVKAQRDFWSHELEQQIKDELHYMGYMPEMFSFDFEWYPVGYMPSVDFDAAKGQTFALAVKAPILEFFNRELQIHQQSHKLLSSYKDLLDLVTSLDKRVNVMHLKTLAKGLRMTYNSETGDTLGSRIQTTLSKSAKSA